MQSGVSATHINYPLDQGELKYYPNFLSHELADFYFETFEHLPFTQGVVASGAEKRKSCFFASDPAYVYMYSGKANPSLAMPDEMDYLMQTITGALLVPTFNSCLANLYEDGKRVIGWHSDSEKSLVPNSTIASISLGATRMFEVRSIQHDIHGTNVAKIPMVHGSMVTMSGPMQKHYKHRIAPDAKCTSPRINLTFRLAR